MDPEVIISFLIHSALLDCSANIEVNNFEYNLHIASYYRCVARAQLCVKVVLPELQCDNL